MTRHNAGIRLRYDGHRSKDGQAEPSRYAPAWRVHMINCAVGAAVAEQERQFERAAQLLSSAARLAQAHGASESADAYNSSAEMMALRMRGPQELSDNYQPTV